MRRALLSTLAAVVGLMCLAPNVRAETRDDLCTPPKMKTEKWQSRSEIGGMTILIPPGFGMGAGAGGEHVYQNGEHRLLLVSFGSGLQSMLRDPSVSEKGECETEIAGRRVNITVYNWVKEDRALSASGDAGAHFAAVARFYASGSHPEVFVAFISNVMYELKSFKQLFWTVSFDTPAVVAATPAAVPVAAPAALNVASQPAANAVAVGASCSAASAPATLPSASAVVDSAVVGTLLASATPIPSGFEVVQLRFDPGGELAGMNVAQSDLPEASQRELAAVIGTNLKVHDGKEPPSIFLRIDSTANGLHYSVILPPGCP